LQTRKWTDQSGVEKYSTEVVLQRFRGELTMLDTRGEGGGAMAGGDSYGGGASPEPATPQPVAAGGDLDDEIPF
jgi:single-strand DNA-binding protein